MIKIKITELPKKQRSNYALGGIINPDNPIPNYANNPYMGIPAVRYSQGGNIYSGTDKDQSTQSMVIGQGASGKNYPGLFNEQGLFVDTNGNTHTYTPIDDIRGLVTTGVSPYTRQYIYTQISNEYPNMSEELKQQELEKRLNPMRYTTNYDQWRQNQSWNSPFVQNMRKGSDAGMGILAAASAPIWLPMAGSAAETYLAPGTTGGTIAADLAIGALGANVVDQAMLNDTGKTWQDYVSDKVSQIPGAENVSPFWRDLGYEAASFTNPGWFTGTLTKPVSGVAQGTYDLTKQGWDYANRNYVQPFRLSRAIDQGVAENGIITGYNRNPRNLDTGSIWDYQSYLDEVFPNSTINDVQWHGGNVTESNQILPFRNWEVGKANGFYTTENKAYASTYGHPTPMKINIKAPLKTQGNWTGVINDATKVKIDKAGYDGVINTNFDQKPAIFSALSGQPIRTENIVFNPNQALILGSNEDAIGFSNWMSKFREKHPYVLDLEHSYALNHELKPESTAIIDFNTARTAQEQPSFSSELDWKNWLSTRPNSDTAITQEEIDALNSRIPEYLQIEQQAKSNGTWLKMPDGSIWQGDPRSWVQMQSKDFQKAFANIAKEEKGNPLVLTHGTPNRFNEFDEAMFGTSTDPGDKGVGIYANAPNTSSSKLYGEHQIPLVVNSENPISSYSYLEQSLGPEIANVNADTRKSIANGLMRNFHRTVFSKKLQQNPERLKEVLEEYPQFLDNDLLIADDYHPGEVSKAYEVVIPFNNPVKSLLGNTGEFNLSNRNIYRGLVPITIGLGAATQSNQQSLGGNINRYNQGGNLFLDSINTFQDGGNTVGLPEVQVVTNYPTEDQIKANIESQWTSAKNLPFYNITKDPTFTREKTGAGSIEYFNEPSITYDNGVTIDNPNSNPTLLFDPNTNTVDDIKLDLLHHYREYDPIYQQKLATYQNALMSNEKLANDVLWNSDLGEQFREKYTKRDKKGKIIKQTFDQHWDEWDKLVQQNINNNEYLVQGVDGSLRNLLANDYTRANSNYQPLEEARQQWLPDEQANNAFNDLNRYLVTGKKSQGGNLFLTKPINTNNLFLN